MIRVFNESGVLAPRPWRAWRGRIRCGGCGTAAGERIGVARSVFFCRVKLYNGIMKLQT